MRSECRKARERNHREPIPRRVFVDEIEEWSGAFAVILNNVNDKILDHTHAENFSCLQYIKN